MQIKLTILIAALLILTPMASANNYSIPIVDSQKHQQTYQVVSSDNYSLQVQNPPALYGNTSSNTTQMGPLLAEMDMDPVEISTATHYILLMKMNNGQHSMWVDFYYEPHQYWFGITRWKDVMSVNMDGQFICNNIDDATNVLTVSSLSPLAGATIRPHPHVSWTYNWVNDPTLAIANGLGGAVSMSFGDGVGNFDLKCGQFNANIAGVAQNSWGDLYVSVITEGFDLIPIMPDANLYSITTHWQAFNESGFDHSVGNITQADFGQLGNAFQCSGLQIFAICFNPAGMLQFMFDMFGGVLQTILTVIPGGNVLYTIIQTPFAMMLGLLQILDDVLLNNGAPYGIGGVFWMHEIYLLSLGFVVAGFTNDWNHVWKIPTNVTFGFIWIIGYGAYFFFYKIPQLVIFLVTMVWNAITNVIP